MKKSLANQICKLWNEQHAKSTPATSTQAVVSETVRACDVEILPDGENDGIAFHHVNELAAISKAFGVSSYVMYWDGKVIGRLF